MNRVLIVGNVARDAEMRKTANDKDVATFTVATNEGFGEKKTTEFHRVVAWDRLAEQANDQARKGVRVFVEGRNQTRKYEKDGQTHYATEVIASNLIFAAPAPTASRDELDNIPSF